MPNDEEVLGLNNATVLRNLWVDREGGRAGQTGAMEIWRIFPRHFAHSRCFKNCLSWGAEVFLDQLFVPLIGYVLVYPLMCGTVFPQKKTSETRAWWNMSPGTFSFPESQGLLQKGFLGLFQVGRNVLTVKSLLRGSLLSCNKVIAFYILSIKNGHRKADN